MSKTTPTEVTGELRKVLRRLHYPPEVTLMCVRWYAAYPLSFRHLEEMMQERGIFVDHPTVHRWVIKILPVMVSLSAAANALLVQVGGWMKPTLKLNQLGHRC